MFPGLWLKYVRISWVSFRQLWQNCIYVSIWMLWRKQMLSERDVFFREFNWNILNLRWSFSAGLSKQHSKCPEESIERFINGKIIQVNFTFLEKSAVGFSELNLACRAFYFEKNCLIFFGKPKLCYSISALEWKKRPHLQKTSESSV